MRINNFLHLILFVLVFISFISSGIYGRSEREIASSLIDEAERAVVSAYNKVLAAERVGVDVSSLSITLNNACDLLVQANISYDIGDFDNAKLYANSSINLCGRVEDEADYLKEAFQIKSLWELRINIIYSISVSVLIICFYYLIWGVLKKQYYQKALSKRPKLVLNEAE